MKGHLLLDRTSHSEPEVNYYRNNRIRLIMNDIHTRGQLNIPNISTSMSDIEYSGLCYAEVPLDYNKVIQHVI